jgi:hypothetical protein
MYGRLKVIRQQQAVAQFGEQGLLEDPQCILRGLGLAGQLLECQRIGIEQRRVRVFALQQPQQQFVQIPAIENPLAAERQGRPRRLGALQRAEFTGGAPTWKSPIAMGCRRCCWPRSFDLAARAPRATRPTRPWPRA